MNGLCRLVLFIIAIILFGCNRNKDTNGLYAIDDSSANTLIPSALALRSIGEIDLKNYKSYDFYLLYIEHRPREVSYVFSLRLQDSALYSYTKYMNNVVSTMYPPVGYLKNKDSIYYTVNYQEQENGVKDIVMKKLDDVNFYNANIKEPSTNHNDTWLIVYDKKRGIHSIHDWTDTNKINTVINYIKDSLMKCTPEIEKKIYTVQLDGYKG